MTSIMDRKARVYLHGDVRPRFSKTCLRRAPEYQVQTSAQTKVKFNPVSVVGCQNQCWMSNEIRLCSDANTG
jgi:hypothetical protein